MVYKKDQYYWVMTLNSGVWKPGLFLGGEMWQVFGNHQTIKTERLGQVGEEITKR
jgi:hypothetical protein